MLKPKVRHVQSGGKAVLKSGGKAPFEPKNGPVTKDSRKK